MKLNGELNYLEQLIREKLLGGKDHATKGQEIFSLRTKSTHGRILQPSDD